MNVSRCRRRLQHYREREGGSDLPIAALGHEPVSFTSSCAYPLNRLVAEARALLRGCQANGSTVIAIASRCPRSEAGG
jgi:hypothetical protein